MLNCWFIVWHGYGAVSLNLRGGIYLEYLLGRSAKETEITGDRRKLRIWEIHNVYTSHKKNIVLF
jgi:hypothetical protein